MITGAHNDKTLVSLWAPDGYYYQVPYNKKISVAHFSLCAKLNMNLI